MSVLVLMARFEAPEGLQTRDLGAAKSRAAQGLLEQAMLRLKLEPWVPEKDPRGMPQPRDGWHVSKSHCRDLLAVAIARCPLGVDAETIRLTRLSNWHRVIDESERTILGEVDALSFTRLWTAKEAALKIGGQGITELSLCRVTAIPDAETIELLHKDQARQAKQHITENHVISVCCADNSAAEWVWSPEDQ